MASASSEYVVHLRVDATQAKRELRKLRRAWAGIGYFWMGLALGLISGVIIMGAMWATYG